MICEVCSTNILPSQNHVTYTQWLANKQIVTHRHADCNLLIMDMRLSYTEAATEMRKLHPLPSMMP